MGLYYYLIVKNNYKIDNKIFLEKNQFKGNVGIFDIKENKINYILNFYKVDGNDLIKIFGPHQLKVILTKIHGFMLKD